MTGRERVDVLSINLDMLNTMVRTVGPHRDEPFRLIFHISGNVVMKQTFLPWLSRHSAMMRHLYSSLLCDPPQDSI
jgi:hypothetical protein